MAFRITNIDLQFANNVTNDVIRNRIPCACSADAATSSYVTSAWWLRHVFHWKMNGKKSFVLFLDFEWRCVSQPGRYRNKSYIVENLW